MAKQERYFIGPRLLADIREAITRVDSIPMTTSGVEQPVRHQHMGRRGGGATLYRGTFTGTWNIGESKAVTFIGSTNTQSVINYSSPIVGQTNATQSLNVIFGSVMGTVSAVEIQQPTCTLSIGGIDLTELPNFDADAVQLLGHGANSTGTTACFGLQWYSVSTCS